MFMELLILWFYIISFVVARKCNEDIDVKSHTDLEHISQCIVFNGSIYISSSIPLIDLGNLQEIRGNLIIQKNEDILRFKALNLTSVHGKIEFKGLTALEKIELPLLTSADTLRLFQCAQLQTLDLSTTISRLNHVIVSDTSLRTLSGFSMSSLVSLSIDNNNYLTNFDMPNLVIIKNMLSFMQNGLVQNNDGISISLPSLESIGGLILQSISSIELEKLKNITGDFGISLSTLTNLSLESLSFVQGSLSIYNNSQLTTLNFPSLASIGGTFLVSGNPKLQDISGFDKVRYIGGSIHWTGFLRNISLPSINDIKGTVKIISSTHVLCPPFTKSRAIVQGANPICKSSIDSDSGSASSHRKNSSNSNKNGSKIIGGLHFLSIFEIICTITIFHLII